MPCITGMISANPNRDVAVRTRRLASRFPERSRFRARVWAHRHLPERSHVGEPDGFEELRYEAAAGRDSISEGQSTGERPVFAGSSLDALEQFDHPNVCPRLNASNAEPGTPSDVFHATLGHSPVIIKNTGHTPSELARTLGLAAFSEAITMPANCCAGVARSERCVSRMGLDGHG